MTLLEGSAEMLGVELLQARPVVLPPGQSRPVFTFHGAVVRVEPASSCEDAYVADESTFPALAAVNSRLEARRALARGTVGGLPADTASAAAGSADKAAPLGPVVVVAGPVNAGKSTAVATLAAWACRRGWSPTVVDLDPGQGDLCPPASVSAAPVDRIGLAASGGWETHALPILSYPVGTTNLGEAAPLFKAACASLAAAVQARASAGAPAGSASGAIVNTCGWVDKLGYTLLCHVIETFNADVVLVLGDDALFARLSRDLPAIAPPLTPEQVAAAGAAAVPVSGPTRVALVKLPVSGGARRREPSERQAARAGRIREYFYGPPVAPPAAPAGASAAPPAAPEPLLSPLSTTLSFDSVRLVKVGGSETASHQLPVGASSQLSALRVTALDPSPALEGSLLALSSATSPARAATASLLGFAVITTVNTEKRELVLQLPTAQHLPAPALFIVTSERYSDA